MNKGDTIKEARRAARSDAAVRRHLQAGHTGGNSDQIRARREEKKKNELRVVEYTLPAFWASAIVNGDFSGLDAVEGDKVENFLAHRALGGLSASCGEEYISAHNDAGELPGMVADFSFLTSCPVHTRPSPAGGWEIVNLDTGELVFLGSAYGAREYLKSIGAEVYLPNPARHEAEKQTPEEVQPLTVAQFRKEIKTGWPYVKISIRTVGFSDLARTSRKCLTVEGDKRGDLSHINALAEQAGILPDGNCRCFPEVQS